MVINRRKQANVIENSYRSLIENIKDYAIFMLDKKGKILSWDQGATKLFGYRRSEIVGRPFSVLFMPGDIKKGVPKADLKAAMLGGRHLDERQYIRKNKQRFWSGGVLTSTMNKHGVHQGFSKIMRNITEQTNLQKTILHRSTHDYLTALPNRNFFEETLFKSLRDKKKDNLLALLFMDFNNFKRINDKQGHRYGDLVLIEIAERLGRNTRMSDMVARLGGDEFIIMLQGFKKIEEIEAFAKKILMVFRIPIKIRTRVIKTSISLGIAVHPKDGKNAGMLLHHADLALYRAKKAGGNRYKFYSDIGR